ncbi:FHA domain-containing protein [Myxococcota bacterium]|nr:FHA domain-containing protein [Myxococcota bacterium]
MNTDTTAIFPKPSPLEGHLWARSGKNLGRRYSLGRSEQVLGRSPACDIEIEDDRVSLQHAKIVTVDGRHHIIDLGSTNGTFVNDARVEETVLHDGDVLQIGETVFEYLSSEERALTITLRGGSQDSVVPNALREGAKQMLQRERYASEMPRGVPTGTSPGIPMGTSPGIPLGTSPGIPMGTSPGIPMGTSPGIPLGTSPGLPLGTPHLSAPSFTGNPNVSYPGGHVGSPAIDFLPAVTQPGVPGLGPNARSLPPPAGYVPQPYSPPVTNMPVPYVPQHPLQPYGGQLPTPYAPQPSDLGPPMPPIYATAVNVGGEDGEDGPKMNLAALIEKARPIIMAFLPYWKGVAFATFCGLALGLVSMKLMPAPSIATFQMSIHTQQQENPMANFNRVALQFFKSAEQNFVSPVVVRKTLTALGYTDVDDDLIKDVQDKLTFNKMGGGIPGHPMNSQSNTYNGTYRSNNPDEAVRFLDRHLKTYLESEVEKTLRVVQLEVDFLAKQLAESQEEMNRAEWELLEFKRKNIDALPDQARSMYGRVFELVNRQRELADESVRYQRALSHQQRKVLFESPTQKGNIVRARPYDNAIAAKEQELAAHSAQGKGPQHPDVIKTRQELEKLQELARTAEVDGPTTSVENVNPTYTMAKDTYDELVKSEDMIRTHSAQVQAELDDVRAKIADLPEREANYATLQRNFDTAKDAYERLLSQERTAKLQLDLERNSASARYDLIVPVQLADASTVKDAAKRMVIGGGLFFFIAVARVFFVVGRRYLKALLATQTAANQAAAAAMAAAQGPAANTSATGLVVRAQPGDLTRGQ